MYVVRHARFCGEPNNTDVLVNYLTLLCTSKSGEMMNLGYAVSVKVGELMDPLKYRNTT